MRTGLSTIQQTLTSEAASVLNQAIAEAARRNHCQTTPLHVAATLLASPSGFLRQACVRSHPNTSHPLQCRALELCFSVALDRLPSATPPSGPAAGNAHGLVEPPISNALMAALKRAQAHQRRGCPEQQQQPLLAVKVELDQLIISILDDPSVSRVMREASFSSPAVKATIEQSLTSSCSASSPSSANPTTNFPSVGEVGFGFGKAASPLLPANRNLYLNPRFQQYQKQGSGGSGAGGDECSGQQRREEVKKVVDILLRSKKRNPVLVGDTKPEAVMGELLKRIENKELDDELLRDVQVISLEKEFASDRSQIPSKLKGLCHLIDARCKIDGKGSGCSGGGGGVILNMGDLKWLVDGPNLLGASPDSDPIQKQQIVSEMGRVAVAEMRNLLARFDKEGGGRVWLIGTATCATYLRCQVYHPSMENDWDLQALPIAPRTLPSMLPRIKGNGILSSSVESLAGPKCYPAMGGSNLRTRCSSENTDPSQRPMCPVCVDNYERELAKLVAKEFEKSTSDSNPEPRQPLPQWLQVAKLSNGAKPAAEQLQSKEQEFICKQKTEELLKRWKEICSGIHPNFQQAFFGSNRLSLNPAASLLTPHNSKLLLPEQFHSKLSPPQSLSHLQGNNLHGSIPNTSEIPPSPPRSPVRTDLVLGRPKIPGNSKGQVHKDRVGDSVGCKPDRFSDLQRDRFTDNLDADSFKRLFTGLIEKVGWQPEAASAVASTVILCKSGDGKRHGAGVKGDSWLLFIGPDKVGKKKMASGLSELVFGTSATIITLGGTCADGEDGECNGSSRGKTTLDRIAEAVRRNPFSVVMLEDVDQADMLVRASIKRATERGRLQDSQGREVPLGSVIFILTANTLPENLKSSLGSIILCEERRAAAANCEWQLELSIEEKAGKRRADWVCSEGRLTKPRKESVAGFSFDLNLAAGGTNEETREEGSRNSSDLTVEHEQDYGRLAVSRPSSLAMELMDWVDEAIVFKPVDFSPLRRKVGDAIVSKFNAIVGEGGPSLQVDDEALDLIVDGIWFGNATTGFEDWTERVLTPSFQHLKSNLTIEDSTTVKLVPVKDGFKMQRSSRKDWLPGKVTIAVNGLLVA